MYDNVEFSEIVKPPILFHKMAVRSVYEMPETKLYLAVISHAIKDAFLGNELAQNSAITFLKSKGFCITCGKIGIDFNYAKILVKQNIKALVKWKHKTGSKKGDAQLYIKMYGNK